MSENKGKFVEKSLDTIIYPDGSTGDIKYHSQKNNYRFIVLDWQEADEVKENDK